MNGIASVKSKPSCQILVFKILSLALARFAVLIIEAITTPQMLAFMTRGVYCKNIATLLVALCSGTDL